MGYRNSYFRKDGTFVQGHFTRNRSRRSTPKKGNGSLLILVIIVLIIMYSSIH